MNQLNVSTQQSIIALLAQGWSQRRIARELTLNRETVARYAAAKPASNLAHGSDSEHSPPAKPATNPAIGSAEPGDSEAKPATNVALGVRSGPPSLCAPFALHIEAALQAGLSAQRIYQDLVCDHGFGGAYGSVKRFVRSLARTLELPFRRMECAPGDELQIDFGCGAWIVNVRPRTSYRSSAD